MSTGMHDAREMIREYVQDIEWDDPFWLDDVQDQFPALSAREIERLYADELRLKLQSWSADELERLYQEQMDVSPNSRNYSLVDVLEGLLSSTEAE
ncbi:MAG: hypothetical protein GX423_01280 [Nitrospiraceae bacterium]|jgi:hypothetical protein|nr:hypothetical protein [Nitrospiraceae bacterium]